jgi:hypothetical protein
MTQTVEERIGDLTTASNLLTSAVENKVGEIDSKVSAKEAEVDNFLQNATPETRYKQIIHIGGSKEFFYPVWFRMPDASSGVSNINVCRAYHLDGVQRPLNSSSPHQAGLLLEMEGCAFPWGGDANFLEIKRYSKTYNATVSNVSFAMYCKAEKVNSEKQIYPGIPENVSGDYGRSHSGLYLRGGGLTYHIIKNWTGDVHFHNGSDELRRDIYQVETDSWSVKFYAEPIPIADIIEPTLVTDAFSDPL